MGKQNISATLDSDLLARLDDLAQSTERNRSWLISKAIESYLEDLDDLRIAKARMSDLRLSPAELRAQIDL